MSNLMMHAERELSLAGLDSPESDYGGALSKAVKELMAVFYRQGHSGMSAEMTIELFTRLARYQTLTENDHSQFRDVSEYSGVPAGTMLQDTRDSAWFSNDSGKTWYNVNAKPATHLNGCNPDTCPECQQQ